METKKIRVILLNGFRYEGNEIDGKDNFRTIIDSRDNKKREFPNTSISMIEAAEWKNTQKNG